MQVFTTGTIVQLISGGPNMTVARASGNIVKCIWYAPETGRFSSAHFAGWLLVKVTKPSPPAVPAYS